MIELSRIEPLTSLSPMREAVLRTAEGNTFGDQLGAAADALSSALSQADAGAAALATGSGDVASAAIARARADVMLEVAAIAASRASGALSALLQIQV